MATASGEGPSQDGDLGAAASEQRRRLVGFKSMPARYEDRVQQDGSLSSRSLSRQSTFRRASQAFQQVEQLVGTLNVGLHEVFEPSPPSQTSSLQYDDDDSNDLDHGGHDQFQASADDKAEHLKEVVAGQGQGEAGILSSDAADDSTVSDQAATQQAVQTPPVPTPTPRRRLRRFGPKQILLKDKFTFVFGVLILWYTGVWLGSSPSTLYRLYIALAFLLFGTRYVYYRIYKLHYYLFDLCYFVNALGVIILAIPALRTPLIYKLMFAYNAGPLAWSIIAMRNSLVFHDFEHFTTLFMHWYPAVVGWTLRWYPDCQFMHACPEGVGRDGNPGGDGGMDAWTHATFAEIALYPIVPYLVWAVLYYLKIFVLSEKRIAERGYDTVYKHMLKNKAHPLTLIVSRFSQRLQPLVYMGVHLVACQLTFLVAVAWWRSYVAHTAFLVIISLGATWNGANFYFEVFAHRYIRGIGLELKAPRKKD